jgi:hypothetical protein
VRRCVEQTFGILKAQWRILKVAGEYSLKWKIADAYNCVILHNMMIRYREAVRCRDKSYYSELQEEFDALAAEVLEELEASAVDDPVVQTEIAGLSSATDAASARARKVEGKEWRDVVATQLFVDEREGRMPFTISAARTSRNGTRGPARKKRCTVAVAMQPPQQAAV